MKKILLEKATNKEILEEVMKRKGMERTNENLNKWKLMLMDTETLKELSKRMAFSKMTKTEIGGIN